MLVQRGVIQFAYDADGNRVWKLPLGYAPQFYINGKDGNTEAVEPAWYGENVTYNLFGNDNVGELRDNGGTINRYYYLKDHLGNIKMVLNSSGGVDSYNDSYPFGEQMPGRNQTGSADGRYKYIGVEQDLETGYLATGKRLYDTWSGRFGIVDQLEPFYPGVSPYCYSFDNPVRYEDPSGLAPGDSTHPFVMPVVVVEANRDPKTDFWDGIAFPSTNHIMYMMKDSPQREKLEHNSLSQVVLDLLRSFVENTPFADIHNLLNPGEGLTNKAEDKLLDKVCDALEKRGTAITPPIRSYLLAVIISFLCKDSPTAPPMWGEYRPGTEADTVYYDVTHGREIMEIDYKAIKDKNGVPLTEEYDY